MIKAAYYTSLPNLHLNTKKEKTVDTLDHLKHDNRQVFSTFQLVYFALQHEAELSISSATRNFPAIQHKTATQQQ
jgi:hypothetical protein